MKLNLRDLPPLCPACQGRGHVFEPVMPGATTGRLVECRRCNSTEQQWQTLQDVLARLATVEARLRRLEGEEEQP